MPGRPPCSVRNASSNTKMQRKMNQGQRRGRSKFVDNPNIVTEANAQTTHSCQCLTNRIKRKTCEEAMMPGVKCLSTAGRPHTVMSVDFQTRVNFYHHSVRQIAPRSTILTLWGTSSGGWPPGSCIQTPGNVSPTPKKGQNRTRAEESDFSNTSKGKAQPERATGSF